MLIAKGKTSYTDVRILKPITALRFNQFNPDSELRVQLVGQSGSSVDIIPRSKLIDLLSIANMYYGAYRRYMMTKDSIQFISGMVHLSRIAPNLNEMNFLQISVYSSSNQDDVNEIVGIESVSVGNQYQKYNRLFVPAGTGVSQFMLNGKSVIGLPKMRGVDYVINYSNGLSRNITQDELAAIGDCQSDVAVITSFYNGGFNAVSDVMSALGSLVEGGQSPVVCLPCAETAYVGDVAPTMVSITINVDTTKVKDGYGFYALSTETF